VIKAKAEVIQIFVAVNQAWAKPALLANFAPGL
jgi:hypothetical protein